MKDENGVEIKVGDYVKRAGYVQYADGLKYKISKKTWKVSRIDGDNLYYLDENGNDTVLTLPAREGSFIMVDHETTIEGVKPTGIPQKYRVHGDVPERGWKDKEIVLIYGAVSDTKKLEPVPDTEHHTHVLVVVDPLRVINNT